LPYLVLLNIQGAIPQAILHLLISITITVLAALRV
jgi:hypothetical protein